MYRSAIGFNLKKRRADFRGRVHGMTGESHLIKASSFSLQLLPWVEKSRGGSRGVTMVTSHPPWRGSLLYVIIMR